MARMSDRGGVRRAFFIVLGASLVASCGHDSGIEPQSQVVSTVRQISILGDNTFLGKSIGGIVIRDGSMYVSDSQNSRVMAIKGNEVIQEFGRIGSGPGEYTYPGPLFIAADSLYVHDGLNRRINMYSLTGHFLRTIPVEGILMTQFAVDNHGNVYVSTAHNESPITKYDHAGVPVLAFGSALGKTGDDLQDRMRSRRILQINSSGDIIAVGQVVPTVEKYTTGGALLQSVDLSDHALFSKRLAFAEDVFRQSRQSNSVAMIVESIAIHGDVLSMLVITGVPGDDLAANTFVEFDLGSWQVRDVRELRSEDVSHKPWLTTHAIGDDESMAIFDARTASIKVTAGK